MNRFTNELIAVLLVIIITILFVKTIYFNSYLKKNIEGFSSQDEPSYLDIADFPNSATYITGSAAQSKKIAMEIMKDPLFINKVSELYKQSHKNSDIQAKTSENISILDNIKQTKRDLESIPARYEFLLEKYNKLNNDYKSHKKKIESLMVNKINNSSSDINNFNIKNLRMKKKLNKLLDSIDTLTNNTITYNDGKILKNIGSDNEFTLVKNTNTRNIEKYKILMSGGNKDNQQDIYYFSLNEKGNSSDVNQCLKCISANSYSFSACIPNDKNLFFVIHTINNNDEYNNFIKLSGNYDNNNIIDTMDNSIQYPFVIISPYNIPGYGVLNLNDKIFIKPIRNNIFQRYNIIEKSSMCEISST